MGCSITTPPALTWQKPSSASTANLFANTIEPTGASSALKAALETAAPSGKVLVTGDYGEGRPAFHWNHLLHHELQISGSSASVVKVAVEWEVGWNDTRYLSKKKGLISSKE